MTDVQAPAPAGCAAPPARPEATGAALHDGASAWRRLGLGLAVATVGSAGMWSIVAIMPGIEAEFAVPRADASLPYTMTMVGFGIGSVLIGRVADRVGIAGALAGAGLLLGLAYALAGMASALWVVIAAQGLVGLGSAVSFGPLMADVSRWFHRRRGLAIGLAACGNYTAGAVWPPVLAAVMQGWDWRAACFLLAGCSALAMPAMALAMRASPPPEPAAPPRPRAQTARTDLSPRALIAMLSLAGIACCMAMAMPQVHIVALCVDYGFGAAAGAQMLSLMLIAGCVSRIASGFAADRFGGAMTLLVGSALQMMALALYLPFDSEVGLTVVSVVFGLAQGGIVPAYAVIVRERLPARDAGMQVGLVISASILGMALGGWSSGWIHDLTGSYHAAFLNGIAWNMLNILLVLAVIFRTGPRPALAR